MKLVIGIFCLVSGVLSVPALQSLSLQNDGSYKFSYETSKETGSHSRTEEKGADGYVRGRYAYEDPTGDLRVVNYQAGDFGYVAKGAVGVAGAPDSQFPAEPTDVDGQEEKTDNSSEGNGQTDGNDSFDEEKEMKLPSASEDGPPEGFPIGFFDQGYLHGFRRLPEPAKEESKDEDKDEDKGKKAEEHDPEKKDKSVTEYFHPIVPFANFHPHTWSYPLQHAAGSHQPVYVYSYQVPQSHGYYYYY